MASSVSRGCGSKSSRHRRSGLKRQVLPCSSGGRGPSEFQGADAKGLVTSRCGRAGSWGPRGGPIPFPAPGDDPPPAPPSTLSRGCDVPPTPVWAEAPLLLQIPRGRPDPPPYIRGCSRESPRLAVGSPRPPAPGALWFDLPFLLVLLLPGAIAAAHGAQTWPVPHTQRPGSCVFLSPASPASLLPPPPHSAVSPREPGPSLGGADACCGDGLRGALVTAELQVREVGLSRAQLTLRLCSLQELLSGGRAAACREQAPGPGLATSYLVDKLLRRLGEPNGTHVLAEPCPLPLLPLRLLGAHLTVSSAPPSSLGAPLPFETQQQDLQRQGSMAIPGAAGSLGPSGPRLSPKVTRQPKVIWD